MLEHRRQTAMQNRRPLSKTSSAVLQWIETLGLLIVFAATLISVGLSLYRMMSERSFALEEILLLFVYLEVIAMIGIYAESHRVPVRYPVYIAITALARYLVLSSKTLAALDIALIAFAILSLSGAVFIIRWCEFRFPASDD